MTEKNLFVYQNYLTLRERIGAAYQSGNEQAGEDMKTLDAAVGCFVDYVTNAARLAHIINMAESQKKLQELRMCMNVRSESEVSMNRSVVSFIICLNFIGRQYKVGSIFCGMQESHADIERFCVDVTNTLFENRRL